MRFWNLLGWILGIPFLIIVGGSLLYCIFYALGKIFNGLKDIVKNPGYYWDEFKKRWKKHYKDIYIYIAFYLIISTIVGLIYFS